MLWAFNTQPTTIPTDGGGISLGDIVGADCLGVSSHVGTVTPGLIMGADCIGTDTSIASVSTNGYGIRECIGISTSVGLCDVGNGLTVIKGSQELRNVNILEYQGSANLSGLFSKAVINILAGGGDVAIPTENALRELVLEGLFFDYGNVDGALSVSFKYSAIALNLTGDTTLTVDASTLPPTGTHHEITLKITSNNNPSLSTPFQAGYLLTLAGANFYVDGGLTEQPTLRLMGAGKEMTLRLTNTKGVVGYRVEHVSQHEQIHNLGVVAGNITLDIRRPWNIAELVGLDSSATIASISPNVEVIAPAHFTLVNNGSVAKTLNFNTNLLSVAGSVLNSVTLPPGYKVDLDVRRNPINPTVSYEIKVGSVSYNQVASGLATSWNPSDKHVDIALTAGNKTTNKTAVTTAHSAVRGFGGKNSDLWRFAVRVDTLRTRTNAVSHGRFQIGIADAGMLLTQQLGVSVSSFCLQVMPTNATQDIVNKVTNNVSTVILNAQNATIGDIFGVLVNFNTRKIWFTKNNFVMSGGNPEAGTGPDFTTTLGAIFYPTMSLYRDPANPAYITGTQTLLNEAQDPFKATWPSFNYWTA